MAREIRIHPLDLESDVAIGIKLNISSNTGKIFNLSYTTLEQAKTNVRNLLLTNEGERIMQPEFGCNIRKILFEPLQNDLKVKLDSVIRSKMKYWLPYIFIQKLNIDIRHDYNIIEFDITFSLIDNKFDTANITFKLDLP